jgi:L-iditol 2-dehydrogenase
MLTDSPIPTIGSGEVLIKMLVCGVCGTDVRKISSGQLVGPTVLGHEVVGEVVESQALERFKPGDRLATSHHVPCFHCHYCRHGNYSMCQTFRTSALDPGGFSEYLRVPKPHIDHVAQRVPDSVSIEEALFMEPVACCLRALKRSRVISGDHVLVVGLGSVGLLFGLLLEQKGTQAWGLDFMNERALLAADFGFNQTLTRWDEQGLKNAREATDGRGFDAVIVSAGTPALLTQLKEGLRDGGTLCLFGGADEEAVVELPWNEVYKRELVITSSYSPAPEDLSEAFRLICEGLLKKRGLPIRKYPLGRISQAIEDVKARIALKAVVTP